jgi:Chorismate mutase
MATSSTNVVPSDARNRPWPDAEAAPMTLADLRRQIDELDRKLVELLNERSKCALEIGKLKQEQHLPLYQPDREKEVLQNAEHNNRGPLSNAAIRRLFERIIDEARSAERLAMHTDGDAQKDS